MLVGQVEIGTANQPGQESSLGEREGADIFIEIDRSRLAKSIDGKAIALTEINLVRVKHKNLLLGQPVLKNQGEKDFRQFSPDGAARRQKEIARKLHGQSAATLKTLVRTKIGKGGGNHAERIHAMVRVKPVVLRGKNGVHQRLGEVLVTNQATLGAGRSKESSDGFGFEPVGLQGGHIIEIRNRHEAIIFEFQSAPDLRRFDRFGRKTQDRVDFQPIGRHGEGTGASDILTLSIASLLEVDREAPHCRTLSNLHLAWSSKDYSRIAENISIQTGINDSRELQVKVDKNTRPCCET